MARFRFGIYLSLAALLLAVPHLTFAAAAGFFGPVIPSSGSCYCNGGPLDWGCVLQIIQNLVRLAVSLGVVMCVVWTAFGGFSLIASGGNPESISTARARVLNSLVGIAVILCAWLVVDFVMKALYNPDAKFGTTVIGPWNNILAGTGSDYCIKVNNNPISITAGLTTSSLANIGGGTGGTGSPSGIGGGTCAAVPSGPCSISSLSGTCFGSNASTATGYCSHETGGNSIPSGVDLTADGHPYSLGLFQINITNSYQKTVDGHNCRDAFSGACSGSNLQGGGKCSVRVTNLQLYNDCVASAMNAANNIQAACTLSSNGSNWGNWRNECSAGR